MNTFDDIRPFLDEEDKETLMEVGFKYLQAKKYGVDPNEQ